ncbi:MAG: M16 family metallopeptidase, partial [Syntrophales bacterium]
MSMTKTGTAVKRIFLPVAFLYLFAAAQAFSYDLEKNVHAYTLENGLRVLILERHISPTVSLYIRHRAGAVDEISGRTGTAHFLEHLMFKGTETIGTKDYRAESKILASIIEVGNALDLEKGKGDKADPRKIEALKKRLSDLQKREGSLVVKNEIDRLYTENGGVHMNASTGHDLTSYYVSLPSNKIELWARIESDRMMNPVFREFYSERDVIREERRQTIESVPERMLVEQFMAAAFIAHPYRKPIIGWPSDMEYLGFDYVRDFFKMHYAPNRTVIAIVGDVSAASTMELIRRYFGKIHSQKEPPSHITEEPKQTGERRVELVYDANPSIAIGYHKPALPSFDDYVFDVIEVLLSRGRTSRLYSTLVERKGLAESVETANGFPGSRYANLFAIFAAPRSPHTAQELESEIYAEIEKLKKEPVTRTELDKVKNQIRMDYLRDLDSNLGMAGKLSYYESVAGDYRYMIRHTEIIEKITPEDVMAAARKYLNRENRTVAILNRKDTR